MPRNTLLTSLTAVFLSAALLLVGCSDQATLTGTDQMDGPDMAVESAKGKDVAQAEADSDLQKELADLREATSQYQDVKKAEADGYTQTSPFVPGMGFHYVNVSLLGGQPSVNSPEALVYDSNDPDQESRNLGAVEYIFPDGGDSEVQDRPGTNLPVIFSTQTSGDWHYEGHLDAWTLHVWVWLDNPKGVFHPTNPRVNSGG